MSTPIEAKGRKSKRVYSYLAGKVVGSGAGSRVVQAKRIPEPGVEGEQVLGQVALKIASGFPCKNALAREAGVLGRLAQRQKDRSRIVRIGAGAEVLECEATDEWLLELEYLDGQTMAKWFEKEWFAAEAEPLDRVRTMSHDIRGLAEALCELNDIQGEGGLEGSFIHRDIKPANVMLTSDGLRLFDFNAARADDGADEYTVGIGTEHYRAPEVSLGKPYDLRVDLFSLGVVAWELLVKKRFPTSTYIPYVDRSFKTVPPFVVPWPPVEDSLELPEAVAAPLAELMTGLITDLDRRLDSPEGVIALLDRIDEALAAPAEPDEEALAELDLVQLLFELRPNGLLAVVADTPEQDELQRAFRKALQVEDQLEAWLRTRVRAAAKSDRQTLIVLAGNAGDGKSHLIDRLIRQSAESEPLFRYIADATHATRPDQTQQDRLERWFAPFTAGGEPAAEKVSLIAINTGMVIRFFEAAGEHLGPLYEWLQYRLGLRSSKPTEPLPFDLDVINLDLRNLLVASPSFFDRMMSRLDPTADDGLLRHRWKACEVCPALATCPVHFNLEALRQPQVRAAVTGLLELATLDPEVHLSPRNIWGFLYRLITGGEERYVTDEPEATPCDVVRRRAARPDDGEWLLDGQLTEVLFRHGGEGSTPLWKALAELDPAFVSEPTLDRMHTLLAVQKERDTSEEELRAMGGADGRLAGLTPRYVVSKLPKTFAAARQRNAAIRRRVIFDPKVYESFRSWGGCVGFERLLEAYDAYCRIKDPSELDEELQRELTSLTREVAKVFVHGAGRQIGHQRFLHVSQPHSRGTSQLMVLVNDEKLTELFAPTKLLRKDAHILAHADRRELLERLGYRPRVIPLSLARHRLIVDLTLHRFLLQVRDGRKPSRRDLAQFEALFYLGEHIGNELAGAQPKGKEELYVYDNEAGDLYKLHRNDFGKVKLKRDTAREGVIL